MEIAVSQVYIEAGINFPFSWQMQVWLTEQLSAAAVPTPKFVKTYGNDFDVVINLSARKDLIENLVKGPSVFRKTKDVEYTLFLPFTTIVRSADSRRLAAQLLMDGVREVLSAAHINVDELVLRADSLIERLASDADMLSGPWPSGPG